MKKSEFQSMINEAVASAIKKLFIDTNFLDALLADAEQRFTATLHEAMASSSGALLAAVETKVKKKDEFDLSIEDDDSEVSVVVEKKQQLAQAAETLLERKGREIREKLGGFNPFSGATIDNAIKMTEAESKMPQQGDTALMSASGSDPSMPEVPSSLIASLTKDPAFNRAVESIRPTEAHGRYQQIQSQDDEDPEVGAAPRPRGRPRKVAAPPLINDYASSQAAQIAASVYSEE